MIYFEADIVLQYQVNEGKYYLIQISRILVWYCVQMPLEVERVCIMWFI